MNESVLLTVDAGNLWQASQLELLQPVKSKTLAANVPAHLRDAQGLWFGLSVRARTIVILALFWPNQSGSGVHVNVSGAGVTKYAKNPQGAVKLLEWLFSITAASQVASILIQIALAVLLVEQRTRLRMRFPPI